MRTGIVASVLLGVLLAPMPLGAQTEGTAAWTYAMNTLAGDHSPAVGRDGTIYAVDNRLHAVKADGSRRWIYKPAGLGVGVETSPAIGPDGTIYVGASDRTVHAVNPDGTLKWIFAAGGYRVREPAVGQDGTIYIWSEDDSLYALDPLGSRKWAVVIPGGRSAYFMGSSPILGGDGTVYVASPKALHAFDKSGLELWTYDRGSTSPPAIGADGTIYLDGGYSSLLAVDPNGAAKWIYLMGRKSAAPVLGPDGTVYAGSLDKKLHAISPDGVVLWTYETDGAILASPAVGADGTVYVGSEDDTLHAVGPDGTRIWAYNAGGDVDSSPAIANDGTIYVASESSLHAVHSASPGLATSSWPKYRQNNQNTGSGQTLLCATSGWVEFAWIQGGDVVRLPVGLHNATGSDVEIQSFTSPHPKLLLDEALPLALPDGHHTTVLLELAADTTGLYRCSFVLSGAAGGEPRTFSGGGWVGVFVDDGSERAETARRALGAFDEARAIDPTSVAAENNRGVLYRLLGAATDAENHLAKALSTALDAEDSFAGIMMNLGVVGSDEGKPGVAGELYEAAFGEIALPAASSLVPEISYNQAWEAYHAGNLAESHDRIDGVVTHEMTNSWLLAKALVLRGAILADEGDPLAARADLESALALDPEGPIGRLAMDNLAVIDAAEESEAGDELPARLVLYPNYPNPFNPETRIGFALPVASDVSLAVYDGLGRRVRELYQGPVHAGHHLVIWDGRDDAGRSLASGLYLLEMRADGFVEARKMTLLR